MASIADVHTRLIVTAGTVYGTSASSAEIRAILRALGGSMQLPIRTSPMMDGSILARFIAALMTCAARFGAGMSFNDPPNAPIGLRHAATTTISFILMQSPIVPYIELGLNESLKNQLISVCIDN